ncbi:MAG: hypothetical protein LLG00_13970 [Planctomycetaceae bacterium]|nr:hypothetical protein [Planctomycetaceae bacterium]
MTNDEGRTPACDAGRLVLLLLGEAERPEFREAHACVERWGVVRAIEDISAAASAVSDGHVAPDLIVVAQSRPGEFSHQAIDKLRRQAPLARIVGLMGSWCEGEMRSGSPWPATARVYWHQWPIRCNRQFRRFAGGQTSSWTLPVTATEEERLLADCGAGCQPAPHDGDIANPTYQHAGGLIAIRSRSREIGNWLLMACRARGLTAVLQRRSGDVQIEGAAAAIFDAGKSNEEEFAELSNFAAAVRPSPTIALLPFPRVEDCRRALSAGATTVISKPAALDDLYAALPV